MAELQINRLTNGNVYLDGGSLFGTVMEVDLPDLKWKHSDSKVLGLVGELEFPTGIEKMSAKLKLNAPKAELLKIAADPFTTRQLHFRGTLDTFDANGKASVAYKAFLRGASKGSPGGKFKPQDNAEHEIDFRVTAYKLVIGNEVIHDVDVTSNKYIVNGKDLMADVNAIQGT